LRSRVELSWASCSFFQVSCFCQGRTERIGQQEQDM
jgi:hypothetical protein